MTKEGKTRWPTIPHLHSPLWEFQVFSVLNSIPNKQGDAFLQVITVHSNHFKEDTAVRKVDKSAGFMSLTPFIVS